jgi:predicted AAA+ superfamily ATPase
LRENIVSRGLYRDIVAAFQVKVPEQLERILYLAAANSGGEFSYTALGETIGADKLTAQTYLKYLSDSFMLTILENYSKSAARVVRKNKKLYVNDAGVRNAYLSELAPGPELQGYLAEGITVITVRQFCEARGYKAYYWRDRQDEVDIVIKKRNGIEPVEVKYRNSIGNDDLVPLRRFMTENKCSHGLVVTKNHLEKRGDVFLIPLWLLG